MQETLVFTTYNEMRAVEERLRKDWPGAKIIDAGTYLAPFQLSFEAEIVDKPTFFEWVVIENLLIYCLELSLDACDPPAWMQNVLTKMKYATKSLPGPNQKKLL